MKHALRSFQLAACAMMLALVVGCTALGIQQPQDFNQKAYAAALAVDSVQKNASLLLKAGKITPADAANALKAADVATEGIRVARAYAISAPTTANSRLDAAVAGLTALTAYLATQGSN